MNGKQFLTNGELNVVVLAAGDSARFEQGDKIWANLNGKPIFAHSLSTFAAMDEVSSITVVAHATRAERLATLARKYIGDKPLHVVKGGQRRQDSVWNALKELKRQNAGGLVAVHDGARPLVSRTTVKRVLEAAAEHGAAVPVVKAADALKKVANGTVLGDVERRSVVLAQTPQIFGLDTLFDSYLNNRNAREFADDAELARLNGVRIAAVEGDSLNLKITYAADLELARRLLTGDGHRWANGYDCHAYKEGDGFFLGGVWIECEFAISAHSDGDVVLHAVCDALLGIAGAGDMGDNFGTADPRWKNASSNRFVAIALEKLRDTGLELAYLDLTVVADRPKLAQHRTKVGDSVARLVNISPSSVNLKISGTDGVDPNAHMGLCATATVTARKKEVKLN